MPDEQKDPQVDHRNKVNNNKDISLEERSRNPYSNLWKSLFLTVGYVLQQSPADVKDPQAPQNTPLRHLVTWLLFVFLLVASVYSGGLASVLTVPKSSTDPDHKTIMCNFRVYTFDELHRKSTTGELAFTVERLAGGHISVMSYLQEDSISTLRLMKGDLYGGHVGMAMRKGSPYMGKMNQLIHRLIVSGILLHWEEVVVKKYMSHRIQVAVLNSAVVVNDGPTKLRIEHIESALFLLLFGVLFSLIAFAFEILRHKYRGTNIHVFKKKGEFFVRTRVSSVPRILIPARHAILVNTFQADHGESEYLSQSGRFIHVNQNH
uniref:Ionotropic glutamate receptor C-terminal domain-containing protein n=1 Tax=Timema bartmani TaxID=61472 RepID=A0A7R9FBM3_9NEOP|nr:unnamed protein product [Timema bartmani]